MRRALVLVLIATVAGAARAASADPSPSIIIFGGGWGAEGTQASLEANVDALARVMKGRHPRILFAAGDPRTRSVQVLAKDRDETAEILGMIFDRRDNIDVTYRPPHTGFDGPATRQGLLAEIDRSRGDAAGTIVFGVGHGGGETDEHAATLELWGTDNRLAADELARQLDAGRRKGPIAFVLGECHAGAFTDIAWTGGHGKGQVASPTRCVLAAVPRDREAAGCTPDVDDPEARGYIAAIADALAHRQEADFDHDGRVSLAEAHAYARIYDDTVDAPVSTSQTWLKKALGKRAARAQSVKLARILEKARPAERTVITRLNPYPADPDAARTAADQLAEIDRRSERLQDENDAAQRKFDKLRLSLLDQVLARYPELVNPYHPEARRLLGGGAAELMAFLRTRRELNELVSLDDAIADREEERLELDKEASRLERFLDAIETVANEELLRKSGPRRDVEVLDRFLACEAMSPL